LNSRDDEDLYVFDASEKIAKPVLHEVLSKTANHQLHHPTRQTGIVLVTKSRYH